MNVGKTSLRQGFTIVELLIVIVVIGILAGITVIAYNGIQNRANDTAIKSDMRNYANRILSFQAETGRLPVGNVNSAPEGIANIKLSKKSYDTTVNNVYLCVNSTKFAVAGKSKSGSIWAYYSDQGIQEYTGTWTVSTAICSGLGITGYTYSNAHDESNGWFSWTQ